MIQCTTSMKVYKKGLDFQGNDFFLALGVCGLILLAMLKEASVKRILSCGEIENRLMLFEYGLNDMSNKAPVLRKKHLSKGKIIGTASQKMCLFKLFPIIFNDIIDRLDTKVVYICLREIISHVYACPFRKSWLFPRLKGGSYEKN
jgi:hypothetical protein